MTCVASQALGASDPVDTNLNTLSTRTPSAKNCFDTLKEEWQIKMMAAFFFIAQEKGFKFHAQSQTSAYSCFFKPFLKGKILRSGEWERGKLYFDHHCIWRFRPIS